MSKQYTIELNDAVVARLSEIIGVKSILAKDGDKIRIDLVNEAGSISVGSYGSYTSTQTRLAIQSVNEQGILGSDLGTIMLYVEKTENNDALIAYLDVSGYMGETQSITIYEGDVTNVSTLSDIPGYESILGTVEFTLGNFDSSKAGFVYYEYSSGEIQVELVRA